MRMFDQMESAMSDIERGWRDVDRATRDATSEMDRFSDAANNGSRDVSDLEREVEQMGDEIDRAGDGADDLGDELRRAGDEGAGAADSIGGAFKKVAGILAAVFAVDKVKDFIGGAIEAAAEFNATSAQYSEVFGDMEGEATKRLEAIGEESSILENRMKGSFTKMAAFAKVGGMDTAESLDLADRSMRAIADSAAFYDRSLEDTTESLQSFLKGIYHVAPCYSNVA